jgi:hypothetical protein
VYVSDKLKQVKILSNLLHFTINFTIKIVSKNSETIGRITESILQITIILK